MDISVTGNFHNVALFFDKVSNLRRIVNIRNIVMEPGNTKELGSQLGTSCQAVTYKFVEQKAAKETTKKKGGRRGQRK